MRCMELAYITYTRSLAVVRRFAAAKICEQTYVHR